MTYARLFKPAVKIDTAQGTIFNLDGQGLRVEWSCTKTNTPDADELELAIYNLAPLLRGAIQTAYQALSRAAGYLVSFSLGWDGVPLRLMRGDVWDLKAEERTRTDVVTRMRIGDSLQAKRDAIVLPVNAKVPFLIFLRGLITNPVVSGGLGLAIDPASDAIMTTAAGSITQPVGNVAAGNGVANTITVLMDSIGLQWRTSGGVFYALRGAIIPGPAIIISPASGLLSETRRNDGGIDFEALADPRVEPGRQVIVRDEFGKPIGAPAYRVERMTFDGSTDGQSLMSVEAAKALVL
jgi:hypothetical protein